ncbi:MAG: hypothetical protein IKS35_06680 [Clostridia bacterium]|nr:hypothetical protein [Clostridia bacterium]
MPYEGYYARKKKDKKDAKGEQIPDHVKDLTEEQDLNDGFDYIEPAGSSSVPLQYEELSKKERFRRYVDSHIRLITFLVCIAIFLGTLGPFSVFQIVRMVEKSKEEKLVEITFADIQRLDEAPTAVEWKDFGAYKFRTVTKSATFLCLDYLMENERFFLRVGGDIDKEKPIYIILIDVETGDKCDLLDPKSDLDTFLERIVEQG